MATPHDTSGPVLRLLPFVVMGIVTTIDVLAGPEVGYLPLLSLGPAFASPSCGIPRTAAVGLLAMVLCLGDPGALVPWCRKTPKIAEVMPLLYLHGLSHRGLRPRPRIHTCAFGS